MRLFLLLISIYSFSLFAEDPWGKDADLQYKEQNIPDKIPLLQELPLSIIRFHQKVLSHADGPRSHFRPTSSRYMYLAIRKHGFIPGYLMGCDRLLRENSDAWVYPTINIDDKIFLYDPIP